MRENEIGEGGRWRESEIRKGGRLIGRITKSGREGDGGRAKLGTERWVEEGGGPEGEQNRGRREMGWREDEIGGWRDRWRRATAEGERNRRRVVRNRWRVLKKVDA